MRSVMRKGAETAFAIVASASTIGSLCDYSLRKAFPNQPWWSVLLILMGGLAIVFVVATFCFLSQRHAGYSTKVNGKTVRIIVGDLFKQDGLKVIPFNERFDIQVDDVVVAHRTLNGMMIDQHVKDKDELESTIERARGETSALMANKKGIFPLGRLIQYDDFLMLAFTHVDDHNVAYVGAGEYEQALLKMWTELRRLYAGKEINIPLVGSGITTISGTSCKDYTSLLKCILCTLDRSNFQPVRGVKIILTKNAIKQIDMNKIREEF